MMWLKIKFVFWIVVHWLESPPETNICYENCSEGCGECGWWRAIA